MASVAVGGACEKPVYFVLKLLVLSRFRITHSLKKQRVSENPEELRKSLSNSRVRRDIIDPFRTMCWYETVRMRTGALSAYALEKCFEPQAFSEKEGRPYHHNRWPAYRTGKRTPRQTLIERVELALPGTARLINHVLWQALRVRVPVLPNVDRWIRMLDPPVQTLLFERTTQDTGLGRKRRPVNLRLLTNLSNQGSLDALAALTILLREAAALGRSKNAFEAVGPTLYLLVAHGSTEPMIGFAEQLFELYRQEIFSLSDWDGNSYRLAQYPFDVAIGFVNEFVSKCEIQENRKIEWAEAIQTKLNVLQGGCTFKKGANYMIRAYFLPRYATGLAEPKGFDKEMWARFLEKD